MPATSRFRLDTPTAGFLVFPHDEPLDSTSYFNFSYAFGGGVDYRIRERQAITIGYKLLHMSNAKLGATNPGVNANFIYIGYRFGRRGQGTAASTF